MAMQKSKPRLGLVPRLILGIAAGILIGAFLPEALVRILVTFASLFAAFLKFVIPFIILAFVICGIADLTHGAGKLLALTTAVAYGSTILAALFALTVASAVFPKWLGTENGAVIGDPNAGMLEAYFTIPLSPMFDVTAAIIFAFMMGLGIAALRAHGRGETLYMLCEDFQEIIKSVLATIIIPLLPVYIAGTFANITYSGQVFIILGLLWKVFCLVIPLHFLYLAFMYVTAGAVSRKNPLLLIKNQAAGYVTALGTQSSAATIPVNVQCAEKNGVSRQIREFVVPLCATIHLAGSIISLTCFSVAILLMNGMDHSMGLMLPFLMILGVAMVAAPGAPGGAVMSALPFLPMIGIATDSAMASLMIALYLTQDSFGTAANVSGDNAIAVLIDTIYGRWTKA